LLLTRANSQIIIVGNTFKRQIEGLIRRLIMKFLQTSIGILIVAATVNACGSDKKKGKSLGIPAIKPPVDSVTPEGLKPALGLNNSCGNESGSPIERMKSRLFCPGPGDFRYRLGMVDGRMQELNTRSEESEKACTTAAPQEWQPPLPEGETFNMYFSCRENMGNGLSVLFGQHDGYHYVAELQNPGGDNLGSTSAPDIAVLARIDAAGNQVEVWQIIATSDGSNWMKVKADKASKAMEAVFMGSSMGYGVGCGVNLRANQTLLFANGIVNDFGFPGQCSGFSDPPANQVDLRLDSCLNAETLADQGATACQSAGLSTFGYLPYKHENVATWDQADFAKSLIKGTGIPEGIASFN